MLGLHNIQNYYNATQIVTIMKWMTGNTEIKWIDIESELATGSIGTLPFLRKESQKPQLQLSILYRKYCKELETTVQKN